MYHWKSDGYREGDGYRVPAGYRVQHILAGFHEHPETCRWFSSPRDHHRWLTAWPGCTFECIFIQFLVCSNFSGACDDPLSGEKGSVLKCLRSKTSVGVNRISYRRLREAGPGVVGPLVSLFNNLLLLNVFLVNGRLLWWFLFSRVDARIVKVTDQ